MAFSAHSGSYWVNYGLVEKTSLDLSFALFTLARNAGPQRHSRRRDGLVRLEHRAVLVQPLF